MGANVIVGAMLLVGLLSQDVSCTAIGDMMKRDVITFYTGPELDNGQFTLAVLDRTFVTFRVRACAEAHVLIESVLVPSPVRAWFPTPRDSQVRTTEIIIGAEENMKIVVKKQGDTEVKSLKIRQIIDCNDYRQFWISWGQGILKFGLGPIYEQQMIFNVTTIPEQIASVMSLYFSTANKETGMWQIEESSGIASMIRTHPSNLFSQMWRSVNYKEGSITFYLKAANNARIALGAKPGVADYIITIGANQNTKHSITKNGKKVVETVKENLLDSQKFKPFWVKWQYGLIQAGQGSHVMAFAFVTYRDKDFKDVGHVGFSTDAGATGHWVFRETDENDIELTSPMKDGAFEESLFISAPHTDYVPFSVQACSDAKITFTTQDDGDDDMSIMVTLGAESNTKIRVDTGFSPSVKVVDYKNLLDCNNYVPLWASWKLGPLRIGVGPVQLQDIILTFDDPIVPKLHTASFGNGNKDVKAYYLISGSVGDELVATIPEYVNFGKVYVTTRQQYYATFSVMSTGGLEIMLTMSVNSASQGRHRVVFDMIGSSIALRKDSETDVVGKLRTPLDNKTPHPFWLSWTDNIIEVGEGHRFGERVVVTGTKAIGYEVKAISFETDEYETEVKMDMESDDLLSIKMDAGTVSDIRWFRLIEDSNWLYVRLANSGVARVSLFTWYRDITAEQFVLSFGEDGENKCVLRGQNRAILATSKVEGEWNKLDLRDFWISWENDKLSVGPSRYKGFAPILSVPFKQSLKALGFYPEATSDIEWVVRHAFGTEATVFSKGSLANDTCIKVNNRNSFVFGVMACEDAVVRLTDAMYVMDDEEDYIVHIGYDGNSRTTLIRGKSYLVGVNSPGILNCTAESYFWISWFEGDISIGKGQQVGEDTLIAYHSLVPRQIAAVSVYTPTENATGMWRVGFLGGSLDPRPDNPTNGGDSGLSGGAIAGIVIGCLLFVFLGVSIAFVVLRGVPPAVQRILPSRHGDTRGLTGAGLGDPVANPEPQYGDS